MPNAQCPMPNAQCPMPHAQCPMPHAPCPMPNPFMKQLRSQPQAIQQSFAAV
ncbi:hypothetical protein [Nostoc sp.]|uniref:hypothetical protein n=1 Tax=Nostoc sp. TaxID=1180 RepID=UPI002A65E8D1|nr:hypothetical protein [Nostoc sp. S13]